MKEWALAYAGIGWPVFPCRPGEKTPMTRKGHNAATTDQTTVREWWEQWPDANIGFAVPEGFAVVDVDIKPDEGKHGDETLQGLEVLHGSLPDTVRSLTGGGGVQHFFQTDTALTCKNGLFDSIDLKTKGGYVILPPSLHPSGRRYEWEIDHNPREMNAAALPGWIVDARTDKKKLPRVNRAKELPPPTVFEGQRNEILFKLASSLRAKGLSEPAMLAALMEENRSRCSPALPEDEVMKLVHSAGKYEQGDVAQEKEGKEPRATQAEILLTLVTATGANFFRNETDDPHAAIPSGDHTEILPLEGRDFSIWLNGIYYRETGKPVGAEAVKQAVAVLSAMARFESPEPITLYTRVAEHGGAFWYDLTNPAWQAIRVTAEGWTAQDNPPILFTRYRHQAAQSIPQPGGDMRKILDYVNIKGVDTLFLCWLVSCFVPGIPHPMPILYGEKGAAKSTASELLKRLIDPSALGTLTLQNDPRALAVNLQQHWFLPFDNVSHINEETSDTLCRAITGGGIQQRKLYTNAEDTIFTFKRCLAINGINNVATRPDLLDRSLLVELERITEADRKELSKVWAAFEADRPAILGGILDTLSKAMGIYPSVELDKLPRMADFARWGYAIGEALGGKGQEFLDQFDANRQEQNTEAINSDPVALLVVAFMAKQESGEWQGLVSTLRNRLAEDAWHEGISTQSKAFPSQPNALSRRLRGIKSNLEAVGISCNISRGMNGATVTLRRANSSSLS